MILDHLNDYEDRPLMFKRNTSMNHVVRLLCVALMICILLFCIQSVEGFKESIPEYCGSAGYTLSPALVMAMGAKLKDMDRGYTQSECDKIDDTTYEYGICYHVKDGKKTDCGKTCKELNTIPNVPPDECKKDGKLLGITNKEISMKNGDKKITTPPHNVRLYTEKECDSLGGKHNISFLAQMSATERKEFITNHGKGYGLCSGENDTPLSFICYAEPPSMNDVSNKASSVLSNLLS